jgi:hypothetical protein
MRPVRLPARLPARLSRPDRIDDPSGGGCTGSIVLGWLTRVTLLLTLVALACFDGLSIAAVQVNLADDGRLAAVEAADTWRTSGSVREAYARAVVIAERENPANAIDPARFHVERDGTVRLHVARAAPTLVLRHLPHAREWARVQRDVVTTQP